MLAARLAAASRPAAVRGLSSASASADQLLAALRSKTPDFEAIAAKVKSPAARADVLALQAMFRQAESELSATPAKPAYPSVNKAAIKNQAAVQALDKLLTAEWLSPEVVAALAKDDKVAKDRAALNQALDTAKSVSEGAAQKAAELKAFLKKLEAARTTRDTTIDDVVKLYPQLEKQVQEEIANHQWGKGLGLGV